MARVEILTEEVSMEETLKVLLPRLLPAKWVLGQNYFIRPHEGKSDLQKSIPRKMKVFSNYHERAGLIIVHDQDSNDCKVLKNKLRSICEQNGTCKVLIRIACQELEAWYLGDMDAIKQAYPNFAIEKHKNKAKFRNPDKLNAYDELQKILPEFQKIASAREISKKISISESTNKSTSFNQFISGVYRFFEDFDND